MAIGISSLVDEYPKMLLVLGRLGIVLMETSVYHNLYEWPERLLNSPASAFSVFLKIANVSAWQKKAIYIA